MNWAVPDLNGSDSRKDSIRQVETCNKPCVTDLHFEHEARRALEAVLNADEEGDGFLAID